MARIDTLGHFLTDVADAIREKKGTSDTIQASDFDTEIENIQSGADLSEYFNTEITANNSTIILKKLPSEITVNDNVTSLSNVSLDISAAHPIKIKFNNNITSTRNLFYNNKSFTSIDCSEMDMSNVTDAYGMFQQSRSITTLDLSNWDVRKLQNAAYMFSECTGLTSLNINNWQTSSLTNMNSMFKQLRLPIYNVNHLDVTNVTNMNSIFYGAFYNTGSATTIDIHDWNPTAVTDTSSMFDWGRLLTQIDMRKMDLTNVTNYTNMFGSTDDGKNNNVPNNCEIIVKDQTQKDWITSKWTRLTNVKTVAEYEAEQSE